MADPRASFLNNGFDPGLIEQEQAFYNGVPDMSWAQARGYGGQQGQPMGYVDPYQQGQKAYEDSIVQGIGGLDIAKPTFHQDLQNYFNSHQDPQASTYQRVRDAANAAYTTHKELQSIFQKKPKYAETYQSLVKSGIHPEDAISQLRSKGAQDEENEKFGMELAGAGYDPDDFKDIQDSNGNFDKIKSARALYQLKNQGTLRPQSTGELKEFDELVDKVHEAQNYEPSLQDKDQWLKLNKGKTYENAYDSLKSNGINAAQSKLKNKVLSHRGAGISVSPTYYEAAGMPAPSYSFDKHGKAKLDPQSPNFVGPPSGVADMPASAAVSNQPAPTQPQVPLQDTVVPRGSMSPADLLRGSLYDNPTDLAGKIATQKQGEENDLVLQAQKGERDKIAAQGKPEDIPKWESAKQAILPMLEPRHLEMNRTDPTTYDSVTKMLNLPNGPLGTAFIDSSGRDIKNWELVRETLNDPRINTLRNQLQSPVTAARITSVAPVK